MSASRDQIRDERTASESERYTRAQQHSHDIPDMEPFGKPNATPHQVAGDPARRSGGSVSYAGISADSKITQVVGWTLVLLALSVLFVWAFPVPLLVIVASGPAGMMPNTAATFLLVALSLLRRNHRDRIFYSFGVLAVGAGTFLEYVLHLDFGLDQLLFRYPSSTVFPGRMSQITAVGFMILGPALALMRMQSATARRVSRVLGLLVGAIGVIALLGYSYGAQILYQVRPYNSMALHTAIAFVIAAVGVHFANPGEGVVRQIEANSPGGAMLRRLLPAALLIPYLLGFIVWNAQKRLGWDEGFSRALLVASVVLCLVVIMLRNAKSLERENIAQRESEERFRLVANTAPVMIWMSGPDKLCNYFNRRWLEFTGRSFEAELGNGWAEGVHPEDLKSCLDTYVEAFDRHDSFRMQYRLRRHDGEYRWIFDIGVPRFNRDCSFAGYIGSCIDITERKLAEEALVDVGRKLIEAQEQERTWIARELHDDINQRIALLAIELHKWDQRLPESAFAVHDYVGRLSQRLTEIARDIQALSHRLHSSQLEYLGLAAAADSFCRELSEQQNLEIDFSHAGIPRNAPQEVSLCLFRVLQEALQNAVKHSGVRHFTVELKGESDAIQLTVSDRGRGFDPQDAMKRHGLGLISMRERLQVVDGRFSIQSAPGRGTTVYARVPLRVESSAAGAAHWSRTA